MHHERITIMDTTLRDGEQCPGGLFTPDQKLALTQMLLERVHVDRVEVASARVQPEQSMLERVMAWAASEYADRIEVLGFVDGTRSVDWIRAAGGRIINLLAKGSERHCVLHLRKTPEEHLRDIGETVRYARSQGLAVNVYLEDWSQGMRHSRAYVHELVGGLQPFEIDRLMLCDTLGVLQPREVEEMARDIVMRWDRAIDFHGHNDYGLVTANVLAAIEAGVNGVHVTVNGLGERAGNAPLDEVVVAIRDHARRSTGVVEESLREVAKVVSVYAGRPVPPNKPISGAHVFIGTAGIHADGDLKAGLYLSDLDPRRFGVQPSHSLGKLAGRASVRSNLQRFGIMVTDTELDAIAERVVQMGARVRTMTTVEFLDVVQDIVTSIAFTTFAVSDFSTKNQIRSSVVNEPVTVEARIVFRGRGALVTGGGTDAFAAFLRGLQEWAGDNSVVLPIHVSTEYQHVSRAEESGVIAVVTWGRQDGSQFTTTGFGNDQTLARIEALIDAMNLIHMERGE